MIEDLSKYDDFDDLDLLKEMVMKQERMILLQQELIKRNESTISRLKKNVDISTYSDFVNGLN